MKETAGFLTALFSRKNICILFLFLTAGSGVIIAIDRYVFLSGEKYIITGSDIPEVDAIIVPGAHVYSNGKVSRILRDRLQCAFDVYRRDSSERILVSGDHGHKQYDEVNTMKDFLVRKGVHPEVIFMDHAGFSTYETLYRSRDIFRVKKAIICTQAYHLPRALFTARALGIEAYGIPSDKYRYAGMRYYCLREIPARVKAFLYVTVLNPKPRFLGDVIPIDGSGSQTDDQKKYKQ